MKTAEIVENILQKYQVRKNRRQKIAFFEYIRTLCDEYGYSCRTELDGKLIKNRNIVIGDVDSANVIFTAHYDTCAVMPLPNIATPQNVIVYILYQILLTLVFFALSFAVWMLSYLIIRDALMAFVFAYVALLLMIYQIMFGIANKHTANDNTSGVLAILETAFSVPVEKRGKYAYVLFDNEEAGLLGSAAFCSANKAILRDKTIINMDCVSDGDNILFFSKKALRNSEIHKNMIECFIHSCKKHGKTLAAPRKGGTFFPSDQANFRNGMAIAAMHKMPVVGLYIARIHTSRDTVMDTKNLECIRDFALEYLERL